MYFIYQIILVILFYDVHFYYFHRLLHTRWLYPWHKKHHEYTHSVAKATFHATHFENTLTGIGCFYPYVLFSDVHFCAVVVGSIVCTVKGIIRHDPGFIRIPILRLFFSDHHILHHKHQKYNYGTWWLDKIHGTVWPGQTHQKNYKA